MFVSGFRQKVRVSMEQHFDLTSITLLTTIALLCGLGLQSFRVPASIGFILAGIVLGPGGIALVSNSESIGLFAELGVLVLLFLIGMEVSLRVVEQLDHGCINVPDLI